MDEHYHSNARRDTFISKVVSFCGNIRSDRASLTAHYESIDQIYQWQNQILLNHHFFIKRKVIGVIIGEMSLVKISYSLIYNIVIETLS